MFYHNLKSSRSKLRNFNIYKPINPLKQDEIRCFKYSCQIKRLLKFCFILSSV